MYVRVKMTSSKTQAAIVALTHLLKLADGESRRSEAFADQHYSYKAVPDLTAHVLGASNLFLLLQHAL